MIFKKKNLQLFPTSRKFKEYPIVETYKFLGITMDIHMNLVNHFQIIKSKTNYIIRKINWIPQNTLFPYEKKYIMVYVIAI